MQDEKKTSDAGDGRENGTENECFFITEKIKKRPKSKKQIALDVCGVVLSAVLFGMVASLVFVWLTPRLEKMVQGEESPEVVVFPEDENGESNIQNNPVVSPTITQKPVVNVVEKEFGTQDYHNLYNQIYQVADSVKKSLVTVVTVSSDVDWLNIPYENEAEGSGVVIADNGIEYLVLTDQSIIQGVEEINVVFVTGEQVEATLKKQDRNTGIAVLAVDKKSLKAANLEKIQPIALGNSNMLQLGNPVIAVGSPLGTSDSVLSGNITSLKTFSDTDDYHFPLIQTDMLGSVNGNGVLLNLNGQVIGIYTRELSKASEHGTVTAYTISELKKIIEKLSNDQSVAYLGVKSREVSSEDMEKYHMPSGMGIVNVTMDSPAMRAGLQSGDIITKIQGKEIRTRRDLENAIGEYESGQNIKITAMRPANDKYVEIEFEVTMGVTD